MLPFNEALLRHILSEYVYLMKDLTWLVIYACKNTTSFYAKFVFQQIQKAICRKQSSGTFPLILTISFRCNYSAIEYIYILLLTVLQVMQAISMKIEVQPNLCDF